MSVQQQQAHGHQGDHQPQPYGHPLGMQQPPAQAGMSHGNGVGLSTAAADFAWLDEIEAKLREPADSHLSGLHYLCCFSVPAQFIPLR